MTNAKTFMEKLINVEICYDELIIFIYRTLKLATFRCMDLLIGNFEKQFEKQILTHLRIRPH